MIVPLPVSITLCLAGLVIFGISTTLMARQVRGESDPLKAAALNATQRNAIDRAILLRIPPDGLTEQLLARSRAEFVVATDPAPLRWMALVYVGLILSLFGLDSIPVVSVVVIVIQCVVLLVGVNSILAGRRMIRFSKDYVNSRGD